MNSIYPNTNDKNAPYYVEFERGGVKQEFTIFRRQWLHTEEELDELDKKSPNDSVWARMCNEVHPWNIFTSTYGPDGCVPDQLWVQWMVDALNNQHRAELQTIKK